MRILTNKITKTWYKWANNGSCRHKKIKIITKKPTTIVWQYLCTSIKCCKSKWTMIRTERRNGQILNWGCEWDRGRKGGGWRPGDLFLIILTLELNDFPGEKRFFKNPTMSRWGKEAVSLPRNLLREWFQTESLMSWSRQIDKTEIRSKFEFNEWFSQSEIGYRYVKMCLILKVLFDALQVH